MGEKLEEKKYLKTDRLVVLLIGMSIVSAVMVNGLYGRPYMEFIKNYGMTIILLIIIFTGIGLSKWKNALERPGNVWIAAGYGISLILIVVSIGVPIYNLWFLGAALIGIFVNEFIGIAMQFVLCYLYCGLNEHSLERMLFYFILGAIICFLGKYLYKASTMVYVTIIVLSCNIIFLFAMNSFIFQDCLNENTVYSVISTFAVLLVVYGMTAVKLQRGGETVAEDAEHDVEEDRQVQVISAEDDLTDKNKTIHEADVMKEAALAEKAILAEKQKAEEIRKNKKLIELTEKLTSVEEELSVNQKRLEAEQKEVNRLGMEKAEYQKAVEEEAKRLEQIQAEIRQAKERLSEVEEETRLLEETEARLLELEKAKKLEQEEENRQREARQSEMERKEAAYNRILEEDYELLQQLKEKSPSLFAHSQKVAEMAENAAVILECDVKTAKAGGLYHEIGRLISKDYIEAGAALLAEHEFPDEVIEVIRQHNAKTEVPKSKEAAIVMLVESIVSTIAYFEKEKKKAEEAGTVFKEQPLDKVVENILDIRFNKGSLDKSGITVMDYKQLKNYFLGIYS